MPTTQRGSPFIIRPDGQLLAQHPDLRHSSADLAHAYARGQLVGDEILQAVGRRLWEVLGAGDALAAARTQAGALTLPIVVAGSDAALQRLPWETLHHPTHGFLALADGFTVLRSGDGPTPALPPVASGPLRVLLFTSLPDDLDAEQSRLDVEEEQAQVLEALNSWQAQGLVQLEVPDDGRLSTLRTLLKELRPHLLFLSGHGKFHHAPHSGEAPCATFLFEGEEGGSQPVREEEIAAALLGSGVECVVLSACESGMTASDALANGLAWRLSRSGIPHVIGMRESVVERAGTLFTRAFCDAIARRQPVDVALQAGRQAITTPLKDSPWLGADAAGLAESSLGQWPLPSLISHDPARPLVDWDFTPQAPRALPIQMLNTISLPARFIGRRAELRALQARLRQGQLRQLLVTGPGGQGKTALAGKLAQLLIRRGAPVFAWSARPGNSWEDFELELELALDAQNAERFNRLAERALDEGRRAAVLLRLLLQQHNGQLVLLFDNLESCQDPATQALEDRRLAGWIAAAQALTGQGLILLLTSRWQLPGWPDVDHVPLTHATYGDFLQMAGRVLPLSFLRRREWLRQLSTTLHGNGRGLLFFGGAVQGMTPGEEEVFHQQLAAAAAETQTDMALAQIAAQLPPPAAALLQRLPAYHTPVPIEGITKLALDLPDVPTLLQRLLAVSLVEPSYAPDLQCEEYQLSPLVAAWLVQQGVAAPDVDLYRDAAGYQVYLFRYERRTLAQAIAAHDALLSAGQREAADRLALDYIVGPLNRQGLYRTLLDRWLPPICDSTDPPTLAEALGQIGKQLVHIGQYDRALEYLKRSLKIRQEIGDRRGEGTTLNNISQIYDARGNYATALEYLERSLEIQQEIGDRRGEGATLNNISQIYKARGNYATALGYMERSLKIQQEIGDAAGMCTTLFNMGHIFMQNEQAQEAVSAWVTVYRLAKQLNLAQALQALEQLAGQLGLPDGLAGGGR